MMTCIFCEARINCRCNGKQRLRWNVKCPCNIEWYCKNKLEKSTGRNIKKQTHFIQSNKNVTQEKENKSTCKKWIFLIVNQGKNHVANKIDKVKNHKGGQKVEKILEKQPKSDFTYDNKHNSYPQVHFLLTGIELLGKVNKINKLNKTEKHHCQNFLIWNK